MAFYITLSFNHFAAVQRWANEVGAQAMLDMRDFTLEVKHRGRYYRMYPMFPGRVDGRQVHMPQLTPEVRGFGGWRPYQTLTHPHSTDKTLFKAYLRDNDLLCPEAWEFQGQAPNVDYVVKARSSSFGLGLFGPYRAGTLPSVDASAIAAYGDAFAEQFVRGRMLKVWYWGAKPFFAYIQEYPAITGEGGSAVGDLVQRRLGQAGLEWESCDQGPVILDCLAFQGLNPDDMLAEGRSAWIDYRYGQLYEEAGTGTSVSDNQLEALLGSSGEQAHRLGEALAALLRRTLRAPVVITVDGILDADGRIWWLEMNTNSLLPPEAYSVMFADLFD